MKRALPIAAALTALTLIAPGAALAGHGHRHYHKAKRRAHHAKVRFEHFGPATLGNAGTGTPGTVPASPKPATPSAPNENAGKVASYTGGVLTLTLSDGSSVSGKVTGETQIECVSATPPSSPNDPDEKAPGDDNGQGDVNGQGDEQSQGDRNQGDHGNGNEGDQPSAHQSQAIRGDDDGAEGQGQPATSEPPCDASALVPGAIVRSAELRIGPSGNEFELIELVR
jgi:hypothetical protein